jgi:hypothetical protein
MVALGAKQALADTKTNKGVKNGWNFTLFELGFDLSSNASNVNVVNDRIPRVPSLGIFVFALQSDRRFDSDFHLSQSHSPLLMSQTRFHRQMWRTGRVRFGDGGSASDMLVVIPV